MPDTLAMGAHCVLQRSAFLRPPKDSEVYLLTRHFIGNDTDRPLHIITSADGRTLALLQAAAILKRLRNGGRPLEDTNQRINRSVERIRQLLARRCEQRCDAGCANPSCMYSKSLGLRYVTLCF